MNRPDILGVEVLTPDGRGSLSSLHYGRVIVHLNFIKSGQVMKGSDHSKGGLHYAYEYEDVEVIKGQYCFNDKRLEFQYGKSKGIDKDFSDKGGFSIDCLDNKK
jgi:hypothetical protein